MNVNLNLASEPFGRNRALWTITVATVIALSGLLVALLFIFYSNQEVPQAITERQGRAKQALMTADAEEKKYRQILDNPGNAVVLERSLFLNQLLYRKGISWTKTFADIEAILPPRVLVMGIRPQLTLDNQVFLEIQAGAETPEDFVQFLVALEESEAFGSPTPRASAPPSDNEPLHRYQLEVSYDQRL